MTDHNQGRTITTVGTHCLVEMHDCPTQRLDDVEFVKRAIRAAALRAKATLLGELAHHFEPQGVTALGLLAESHISIHTWPEYGYAAADVFTCGDIAIPQLGCQSLVEDFQPRRYTMKTLERGGPELTLSPPQRVAAIQDPSEEASTCREPMFARTIG